MTKSYRVLSCVPQQKYHFAEKVDWARQQIETHRPDVLVLPQEYHGGIQSLFFRGKTDERVAYRPDEITDPYLDLARRYGVGVAVGALVDCPELGQRRERIWVLDPDRGITGSVDKMFLPGYDHIDAKGLTEVFPEVDLNKRAVAFDLLEARVTPMFCWEVYSSYLWHAIARAQPDMVFSMIKFGVCGWPQKAKQDGHSIVTGFGFGGDGGWVERLRMAAKWDLACPILCSTNSWDLPKKTGALAGQILPWQERAVTEGKWPHPARVDTLWQSTGKGFLDTDYVQVDQVDFLYWRYIRDHKFTLNEATGEWPSAEARELTMNWKIKRMERGFTGLPKLMAGKPNVKAKAADQGLLF